MQMPYVTLEKVQHDTVTKMFAVQAIKNRKPIVKNATFEFGRETGY